MFIKRLNHDARELKDAVLGWDVFRCRDYGNLDRISVRPTEFDDLPKIKPIFGYTIILAMNLLGRRFFRRFFIKTT